MSQLSNSAIGLLVFLVVVIVTLVIEIQFNRRRIAQLEEKLSDAIKRNNEQLFINMHSRWPAEKLEEIDVAEWPNYGGSWPRPDLYHDNRAPENPSSSEPNSSNPTSKNAEHLRIIK